MKADFMMLTICLKIKERPADIASVMSKLSRNGGFRLILKIQQIEV